jgi:hypothetical protein
MSRWVAYAITALLLSSCQRQAMPEPSTVARPAAEAPNRPATEEPKSAAPPRAGLARPATPRERATVDDLVRAAEAVRQLKLREPVQVEIEDGEAIAQSLRTQIDDDEIERARIIYGALGLLDTESDIRSMFVAVLGEQVIGYYDPETRRLVVRDTVMVALAGEPSSEQTQEASLVLVHELVHALQDQRLGLGESYEQARTADADNAFRAVVEGDATLAMLAHALGQQGIPLSAAREGIQQMGSYLDLNALVRGEKLDDAPAIVRVTLVAPYLRGLQFIASVEGRGGWPAVNNAHRRPPLSTEQVIHPQKYFDREPPERIDVADHQELLASGFERVEQDTLGELELSVYLGQRNPSGTNDAAAAGWAGDQLVVYRRGEELGVVWWTTWDSEAEAEEAYRAAQTVAPSGTPSLTDRKGRAVLIVLGLPAKLHRSLRSQFTSFARAIEARPAPPTLRPSPVY